MRKHKHAAEIHLLVGFCVPLEHRKTLKRQFGLIYPSWSLVQGRSQGQDQRAGWQALCVCVQLAVLGLSLLTPWLCFLLCSPSPFTSTCCPRENANHLPGWGFHCFSPSTSVFFPRQPGAELELPGLQQIYGNSRVTFQDHISKPAPSSLGWAQDSGESHLVLCAFLPNTNLQSTSSTSDLCVQINPFPQTALHYFWYLNGALIKAGYAWV